MAENKTRVDFNAPESLVEEADTVAELLGESRTQLLIDGLRKELEDVVEDATLQRRIREAYYEGEIELDAVETVLGAEEAMRMRLLKQSLDAENPIPPAEDVETVPREEFYDGEPPTWPPDDTETESDRDDV